MSREIKFRAWTNKGEESEYRHGMMYDLAFTEFAPVNDHLNSVNTWGELMQYTGLKDKNGTEIYEGDITEQNGYTGIVYYNEDEVCFAERSVIEGEDGAWLSKTCEVIGNIYENPELLENL